MKASRINHIGVVVKNLDKAVEEYSKMFGWGPWTRYTFAPPALRDPTVRGKPTPYSVKIAVTRVGSVQFEIIEPLDGPSIYKEFLEKRGEGLHHIGCHEAEDVKTTLNTFRQLGVKVLQSGKFFKVLQSGKLRDTEFYYMDTESALGTIYETRRV